MRVTELRLRDFRGYEDARVAFGSSVTVISGPNGAGKTNLLEGLYFGCTGRSCRTNNEREVLRFGTGTTRVVVTGESDDGQHELAVGFEPGQPKRMRVDGAAVERLLDSLTRPLVSVFMPDRLELVKGPPSLRRAHLDQLVSALWPARAGARRSYTQTLAQRNALIARIRRGAASRHSLAGWDRQLAVHGVALMSDRAAGLEAIAAGFAHAAGTLGLDGQGAIEYRPRSRAESAEELEAELAQRLDSDLERGFTGHGPHRDDLVMSRDGRDLRAYGSQGQQRLALLALLLSERDAIAGTRREPPLMLLDDVMSELDRDRREALTEALRAGTGQAVITTTDIDHVPGANDPEVTRIDVSAGHVLHTPLPA